MVDQRAEELRAQGLDEDAVRAWLAAEDGEDPQAQVAESAQFVVWPANWPALRVWVAVQNQWRFLGGRPQGLRLCDVDVALRRLRVDDADTVFAQLLEMQETALEVFDEQQRQH